MTVLSDNEIARAHHYGGLDIDPYDADRVQPASYDVVLADEFIIFGGYDGQPVDLDEGFNESRQSRFEDTETCCIRPGETVLGSTTEVVTLPDNMTASVEPRSSAARNGLVTDGWVDPGWSGQITLELTNANKYPMIVHAGSSYCQLVFEWTGEPATHPYGGRYQGQSGVTPSKSSDET